MVGVPREEMQAIMDTVGTLDQGGVSFSELLEAQSRRFASLELYLKVIDASTDYNDGKYLVVAEDGSRVEIELDLGPEDRQPDVLEDAKSNHRKIWDFLVQAQRTHYSFSRIQSLLNNPDETLRISTAEREAYSRLPEDMRECFMMSRDLPERATGTLESLLLRTEFMRINGINDDLTIFTLLESSLEDSV
jgi:hypothetical protein